MLHYYYTQKQQHELQHCGYLHNTIEVVAYNYSCFLMFFSDDKPPKNDSQKLILENAPFVRLDNRGNRVTEGRFFCYILVPIDGRKADSCQHFDLSDACSKVSCLSDNNPLLFFR